MDIVVASSSPPLNKMADVDDDVEKDDGQEKFNSVKVDKMLSRAGRRPLVFFRTKSMNKAPEFLKRLSGDDIVNEHSDAKISCKVCGLPRPNVRWYKDDYEITSNAGYNVDQKDDGTYILRITDAKKADEGVYCCRVENDEGSTSSTFYLAVKVPRKKKVPKRRSKSQSPTRRNVSYPPLIPTIVEKIAEEEIAEEERANLPSSPLIHILDDVRPRPAWPDFLGDWAFVARADSLDDTEVDGVPGVPGVNGIAEPSVSDPKKSPVYTRKRGKLVASYSVDTGPPRPDARIMESEEFRKLDWLDLNENKQFGSVGEGSNLQKISHKFDDKQESDKPKDKPLERSVPLPPPKPSSIPVLKLKAPQKKNLPVTEQVTTKPGNVKLKRKAPDPPILKPALNREQSKSPSPSSDWKEMTIMAGNVSTENKIPERKDSLTKTINWKQLRMPDTKNVPNPSGSDRTSQEKVLLKHPSEVERLSQERMLLKYPSEVEQLSQERVLLKYPSEVEPEKTTSTCCPVTTVEPNQGKCSDSDTPLSSKSKAQCESVKPKETSQTIQGSDNAGLLRRDLVLNLYTTNLDPTRKPQLYQASPKTAKTIKDVCNTNTKVLGGTNVGDQPRIVRKKTGDYLCREGLLQLTFVLSGFMFMSLCYDISPLKFVLAVFSGLCMYCGLSYAIESGFFDDLDT